MRAIEVGADDAFALTRAAQFFAYILKDTGTGDALVDQAVAVNPNLAESWRIRGWISVYTGRHEPAFEQFSYAVRLNPLDPQTHMVEAGLAAANFFLRRFEVALSWATKSAARQTTYGTALRIAMLSYAMLGRSADAQMMLARIRETGTQSTISQLKRYAPYQVQEDVDLYFEACRIAGVPE